MGEFFRELKPLGVVAAVVSIVWLTAMSDLEPRAAESLVSEGYVERMVEAGDQFEGWDQGWGLVNVEIEAE